VSAAASPRLRLPQVTLCAAACVNVETTISAMVRCLAQGDFARALLFSDAEGIVLPDGIGHVPIPRLHSSSDYSRFVLHDMVRWIETSHCLIVQWDGFILDAGAWDAAFLDFDYIGAPWPQFTDGHDVGNGGFSLRSRRLMQCCLAPQFVDDGKAEDLVVARLNREWLEQECGMRFADRAIAARFSFERDHDAERTFGFHGVFNLPEAVGVNAFWDIYCQLDDRTTVRTDFWPLLRALMRGPAGLKRAWRFLRDRYLA